jgi:hypothetical protein
MARRGSYAYSLASATSEFLLALGLAVRSEANKVIRKPLVWHRIIHTG